jgi:hypothetical protein
VIADVEMRATSVTGARERDPAVIRFLSRRRAQI